MVMESYLYLHDFDKGPQRKKRKRVNELDPNANLADIRYQDNYGL